MSREFYPHYQTEEDIAGDRMRQFFLVGTALTVATAVTNAIPGGQLPALAVSITNIITGSGWNYWDSRYGAMAANNDLQAAAKSKNRKKSKYFFALANEFWSKLAMPGLTTWGAALMVKSFVTTVIMAHNAHAVLGAAAFSVSMVAASIGSFSFAGAMFIAAAQSGWNFYKSWQKTDANYLQQDREEKLSKLEAEYQKNSTELRTITARISVLQQDSNVLIAEDRAQNPQHYEDGDFAEEDFRYDENTAKEDADMQIATLQAKQLQLQERQHYLAKIQPRLKIQIDALELQDNNPLKQFLLLKQQHKMQQRRLDTIAWTFAGVGAVLGGLAFLFPPAAIALGVAGACCYIVAAGLKGKQLLDKRQAKKRREKAFSHLGLQEKDEIQDFFLKKYLRELSPSGGLPLISFKEMKAGLSEHDIELIVDWGCEKLVAEIEATKTSTKVNGWDFFKFGNAGAPFECSSSDEEKTSLYSLAVGKTR